jgi:excisionase family DNA binding protein
MMSDVQPDSRRKSTTYYTTREAARLLGVSLRTVQLWVESGRLVATKTLGGHRRIQIDSVEQLRAKNRVIEVKPSKVLNVLIAEDNVTVQKLYELTLKQWGLPLEIRIAKDGFDALLKIGDTPPDILISDIDMPGMDGIAMINTLIGRKESKGIEIIVVTGLDSQQIQDRGGLPTGITVYMKPVPFGLIQARIQQIADRKLLLAS